MTEEEKNEATDPTTDDDEDSAVATEEQKEDEVKFVEDPVFNVEYQGECAYSVNVTVSAANTKNQMEEMLGELQKEAELPGFRKGRAPRKLLEKKFSKAVRAEAEIKLVQGAFEKLVEKEELRPIAAPEVDGLDGEKDRGENDPLEFTLKFEVAPRVELGTYRGLELERPVVTVDDADVDDSVEEIRNRYATYENLEGGVAATDDQVVFDFKGTIDGEEFEGGSAENYPYILGSKRFFPEFEDVLLGCSPDDELNCNVTFPDDYFSEALRNKTADFSIKVSEVKRKVAPELDDDFAEQAGYENLDDMKEKIKDQLREGSLNRSKQIVESRALSAVVENSTFEIPKTMVERVKQSHVDEEVQRLRQARASHDQISERMADIENSAEERALSSIKAMIALNEIGEAEGIEVTEEDFEKEISDMSQQMGMEAEMVAHYLQQDEDRRSSYVDRIYRAKAMAAIVDNATVTDKEIERDDLENEDVE